MDWKLKPIKPIGTSRGTALVCTEKHGCFDKTVDWPVYPESENGKKIRETRKARGFVLREAARILGMTAVDLSKIECGSAVFDDEDVDQAKLAVVMLEKA